MRATSLASVIITFQNSITPLPILISICTSGWRTTSPVSIVFSLSSFAHTGEGAKSLCFSIIKCFKRFPAIFANLDRSFFPVWISRTRSLFKTISQIFMKAFTRTEFGISRGRFLELFTTNNTNKSFLTSPPVASFISFGVVRIITFIRAIFSFTGRTICKYFTAKFTFKLYWHSDYNDSTLLTICQGGGISGIKRTFNY